MTAGPARCAPATLVSRALASSVNRPRLTSSQAVTHYTTSIAARPTAVTFANRAMARLKLGQHAEAEADCSQALALDPRYLKALQRRSTARRALKRLLLAIEDCEAALLLEPGSKARARGPARGRGRGGPISRSARTAEGKPCSQLSLLRTWRRRPQVLREERASLIREYQAAEDLRPTAAAVPLAIRPLAEAEPRPPQKPAGEARSQPAPAQGAAPRSAPAAPMEDRGLGEQPAPRAAAAPAGSTAGAAAAATAVAERAAREASGRETAASGDSQAESRRSTADAAAAAAAAKARLQLSCLVLSVERRAIICHAALRPPPPTLPLPRRPPELSPSRATGRSSKRRGGAPGPTLMRKCSSSRRSSPQRCRSC